MEELTPSPTGKIFKQRAISVATFFGGPLATGYMAAANFKVLGEPGKVRATWIWTIVASVIIFGACILIPDSIKMPNEIIPLIYTAIGIFFINKFQGEKITAHLATGGETHSWWRSVGIGLGFLAITLVVIVGLALGADAAKKINITTKTYGAVKNEVQYKKDNITASEVNGLAAALTQAGFFDDVKQKFVFVEKLHNDYNVVIICNESIRNNAPAVDGFRQFRTELQELYPNNHIGIFLAIDDFDHPVEFLR